jgi:hypothetical protein
MINIYLTYYDGKTIGDKSNTFYITNSPFREKRRLFTIYNPTKLPFNKEQIRTELIKHTEKDFYSVDIHEIFDYDNNIAKGEMCHIVLDHIYSRKSFEPILKLIFSEIINDYKNTNTCDQ